jgi:hypothetical protein
MARSALAGILLVAAWTASPTAAAQVTEAEILALEYSGELLPPAALTAQIESDLSLIRSAKPVLEKIDVFPRWAAGEILLRLTEEAAERFDAGEHEEHNALNAKYGLSESRRFLGSPTYHFRFDLPYHPDLLSGVYDELADVEYAEPNYTCCDGPDIEYKGDRTYIFVYAWGDCMAGCLNEHVWEVQVSDGSVVILQETGDPLPSFLPAGPESWGALKSRFGTW